MSLPPTRAEWVRYLRWRVRNRRPEHRPISFGNPAAKYPELHRRPVSGDGATVRGVVIDSDGAGTTVDVICPYCGERHAHVVADGWSGRVDAPCGYGRYQVVVE